jgi:predicted nuclease of restriction endonuclease-like (RecB) superfamily
MRQFVKFYPSLDFAAQAVPQLPWGHIISLIQKVKAPIEQEWYARQAIEQGWARPTLDLYIKRNLYQHQAILENKASNFLNLLPPNQSALAQDLH